MNDKLKKEIQKIHNELRKNESCLATTIISEPKEITFLTTLPFDKMIITILLSLAMSNNLTKKQSLTLVKLVQELQEI